MLSVHHVRLAFLACPAPVSSELNPLPRRPVDNFDDDEDLQFSGLTGGRLVHDSLLENGVDTVFGYSGGANLPILDQFHDSKIRFVMNRSEQCCGHAAEGYARSSGRTGVILTTSGPGLTNIITPLQDARGDSTPLVALSGQVRCTKNACTRCPLTAVLVPHKRPQWVRWRPHMFWQPSGRSERWGVRGQGSGGVRRFTLV